MDGLGTRHRAAVGITDVTDCVVVVVSEETHKISIANHGNIQRDFNQNGEELRNPETRQRVEKALRRALHSMLIGLEIRDAKGRKEKEKQIQIRFKWGFNLDAEDRERITKEREKQSIELEKFEKIYNQNARKKATAIEEAEEVEKTCESAVSDEVEAEITPAAPSAENAGLPSISLTPADLTHAKVEDGDASDEN